MALPDIATLTDDELRALLSQADALLAARARDNEATEADLRVQVGQAIAALDALIGDGDPKGLDSLVAVQQYTDAEMGANAGLALRLAFIGMEQLARTTRDIARIASGTLTN